MQVLTLRKRFQIHLNIYHIREPVAETIFLSVFGKRTLNKRNIIGLYNG
jgi:hypothetical protein